MLHWREPPESEKSYRAPLILLPVKLERRSAQAAVMMRQLPDEEQIFNLKHIEMLQTDYAINLDMLRGQLGPQRRIRRVDLLYSLLNRSRVP